MLGVICCTEVVFDDIRQPMSSVPAQLNAESGA